ncbi:class F sortase [Micromonospora cathayae]|uniref:Class F sortase n=1 Tax=Micromonospora cathayae TaxID=3028804 RepID=A0ABY7ZPM3_9ACTN|nr:class F sortase [Micromonospora sp. HUAS 3]WDZ84982.1 class F sortase [Micromonospora sp. HUAS 3]
MSWSDTGTPRAGGRHGKPWRAAGTAVVLLTAALGAGMLGAGLTEEPAPRPPQPVVQAGAPDVAGTPAPADDPADPIGAELGRTAGDQGAPGSAGLPRSTPTTITIPRIGVNAPIMSLGVEADGTVQMPPLQQARNAGWYSRGPSPGEIGNAVIVGHVDSAYIGPAVFFDLGTLLPGDAITVARADGTSATFRVDTVRSYPKTEFPAELVYGGNDRPGLRVVTCGGTFDERTRDYLDNVIVFATLVS